MIDLKEIQDRAWANKVAKGFNTTNVEREFNYTYAELAEVFESYRKQKGDAGEELADVVLFVLSLAKMLGVEDLEREILRKLDKNDAREYQRVGEHNVQVQTSDPDDSRSNVNPGRSRLNSAQHGGLAAGQHQEGHGHGEQSNHHHGGHHE